ncbi:hypothetical protein PMSM_04975 [Paenibacillus macquariensis subsp. macquariensis]|nr:hypothetical protein PMSM_04975 [Paenibacillus macquariensis subsp. macquariensis]
MNLCFIHPPPSLEYSGSLIWMRANIHSYEILLRVLPFSKRTSPTAVKIKNLILGNREGWVNEEETMLAPVELFV